MPLSITPGPLEVMDNYTASFHNENPSREEEVWEVVNRDAGETIGYATTEANARAIAALPEMLDLLRATFDPVPFGEPGHVDFNEAVRQYRALLNRLGAA